MSGVFKVGQPMPSRPCTGALVGLGAEILVGQACPWVGNGIASEFGGFVDLRATMASHPVNLVSP
jgi:hypothetical protein